MDCGWLRGGALPIRCPGRFHDTNTGQATQVFRAGPPRPDAMQCWEAAGHPFTGCPAAPAVDRISLGGSGRSPRLATSFLGPSPRTTYGTILKPLCLGTDAFLEGSVAVPVSR